MQKEKSSEDTEIKTPSPELLPITSLTTDKTNPNRMSDSQLERLKTSIEKFGFIVPIITNKDLLVADGEQRLTVAQKLHMWKVPVVRLDVEDVDRRLLRQVLNKLRGEHELVADALEFERIIEAGREDDLKRLLDLSDSQLERYLQEVHEPKQVPPPKPLEEVETDIQIGDRFNLGDSQLICGDCMEAMRTLAPNTVDFAMFSPPYWGLRDYGEDVQTIWGGAYDCEHEWVSERMGLVHENRNFSKGTQEQVHKDKKNNLH